MATARLADALLSPGISAGVPRRALGRVKLQSSRARAVINCANKARHDIFGDSASSMIRSAIDCISPNSAACCAALATLTPDVRQRVGAVLNSWTARPLTLLVPDLRPFVCLPCLRPVGRALKIRVVLQCECAGPWSRRWGSPRSEGRSLPRLSPHSRRNRSALGGAERRVLSSNMLTVIAGISHRWVSRPRRRQRCPSAA